MSKRLPLALATCALVLPSALLAQAAQQPPAEMRYVTVTTFRVPLGPDRAQVLEYMEKWMVPPARMNPNVLSYRVGFHNWGPNSSDMVVISEFASWEAISADCAPCDKWAEDNTPTEGTPDRKTFDELLATFLKYYSTHSDQIYLMNMRLAKE